MVGLVLDVRMAPPMFYLKGDRRAGECGCTLLVTLEPPLSPTLLSLLPLKGVGWLWHYLLQNPRFL